jgi:transcriptional regulator of arginine metabolism
MKNQRQKKILELIEKYDIETQEELTQLLQKNGITATQATVSRDIKELRIVKQSSASGEYKYCIPANNPDSKLNKYHAIFAESVVYTDCAMGICLVKCHVGTAQAACTANHSMNLPGVLGTLAGDDTIFILCRNEDGAADIKMTIDEVISSIK